MPTLRQLGVSNLSAAARKMGVDLGDLLAANPQISNPNMVFPGTSVRKPRRKRSRQERQSQLERVVTSPTFADVQEQQARPTPNVTGTAPRLSRMSQGLRIDRGFTPAISEPRPDALQRALNIGPNNQPGRRQTTRRQRAQLPPTLDPAARGFQGLTSFVSDLLSGGTNLARQQAAAEPQARVPASVAPFQGTGQALAGAAGQGVAATLDVARRQAEASGNQQAAENIARVQEGMQAEGLQPAGGFTDPFATGIPESAVTGPGRQAAVSGGTGEPGAFERAVERAAPATARGELNRQQLADARRQTAIAMFGGVFNPAYGPPVFPDFMSIDVAMGLPFDPQSEPMQQMFQETFGVTGFDTVQEFLDAMGYQQDPGNPNRWFIPDEPVRASGYGGGAFLGGGGAGRSRGRSRISRGVSRGRRSGFGQPYGLVNWRIGL